MPNNSISFNTQPSSQGFVDGTNQNQLAIGADQTTVKTEAELKTDCPITDPNATAARDKEKLQEANRGFNGEDHFVPVTPEQAQARWNQMTEQDINKANGYEGKTDPLSGEFAGFSKKDNQRIQDLKNGAAKQQPGGHKGQHALPMTQFNKEFNPGLFNASRDAIVEIAAQSLALAGNSDITTDQTKLEIMKKHQYEMGYSNQDIAVAEKEAKDSKLADGEEDIRFF